MFQFRRVGEEHIERGDGRVEERQEREEQIKCFSPGESERNTQKGEMVEWKKTKKEKFWKNEEPPNKES